MANATARFVDTLHGITRNPLPELGALGLGVAAGAARFFGAAEPLPAMLVAAAVGVALVGFGIRAAVDSHRGDGLRLAGAGLAVVAALLALGPAWSLLHPGAPEAEFDVTPGQPAKLEGVGPGSHRLAVSGHLPAAVDDVQYDLTVGGEAIHGEIVRTHGRSRVGRRGSAVTTEEHNLNFHDVAVSEGAPSLEAHVAGSLQGPLHVAVYPELPPALLYAAGGAGVLAAVFLDERLKAELRLATVVATGAVFGLVMHRWGTPAVGPTLGATFLGFLGGGALVWLLSKLLRPVIRSTPEPVPARR